MARKKEIEVEVTDGEEKVTPQEGIDDDIKDKSESPETDSDLSAADKTEADESEQAVTEEEDLRSTVADLEDKLLRAAAEFDNYKKRVSRQYIEMERNATGAVLEELLEIVDNFERALSHNNENTTLESYHEGIKLIFEQINNLLARYDVVPIESVGKTFDPNLHEALMQVASDEYEEGVVCLEMTRGYRQGNRVLRHSKVGVSSGKSREETTGDNNKEE